MKLFYGEDQEYDVQVGDEVDIVVGELRVPAAITKILPRKAEVVVEIAGGSVLDLIALRKTARLPLSAIEFTGRGA